MIIIISQKLNWKNNCHIVNWQRCSHPIKFYWKKKIQTKDNHKINFLSHRGIVDVMLDGHSNSGGATGNMSLIQIFAPRRIPHFYIIPFSLIKVSSPTRAITWWQFSRCYYYENLFVEVWKLRMPFSHFFSGSATRGARVSLLFSYTQKWSLQWKKRFESSDSIFSEINNLHSSEIVCRSSNSAIIEEETPRHKN